MAIIGNKKNAVAKKWKPVRQDKTAEQRKNDELYGLSAKKHGVGKKGDGTLMCQGTDWKVTNQTHSNSPVKRRQGGEEGTCKDKKFLNLQSNILSNEDPNN